MLQARKCGIKQYATSSTTLWSCNITGGTHGLVACGNSQAFLEGCSITDCGQDGIVVLQQAGLHLSHSSVSSCKGPGIDVSDDGTASLKHVDIKDCIGGVWLWQRANCEVRIHYVTLCHIALCYMVHLTRSGNPIQEPTGRFVGGMIRAASPVHCWDSG
jgi:hypothetical protein